MRLNTSVRRPNDYFLDYFDKTLDCPFLVSTNVTDNTTILYRNTVNTVRKQNTRRARKSPLSSTLNKRGLQFTFSRVFDFFNVFRLSLTAFCNRRIAGWDNPMFWKVVKNKIKYLLSRLRHVIYFFNNKIRTLQYFFTTKAVQISFYYVNKPCWTNKRQLNRCIDD